MDKIKSYMAERDRASAQRHQEKLILEAQKAKAPHNDKVRDEIRRAYYDKGIKSPKITDKDVANVRKRIERNIGNSRRYGMNSYVESNLRRYVINSYVESHMTEQQKAKADKFAKAQDKKFKDEIYREYYNRGAKQPTDAEVTIIQNYLGSKTGQARQLALANYVYSQLEVARRKKKALLQEGGGKCSLCGSEGTNKSTCPLNPSAISPNASKHPNASSSIKVKSPVKIKSPVKVKSPAKSSQYSPENMLKKYKYLLDGFDVPDYISIASYLLSKEEMDKMMALVRESHKLKEPDVQQILIIDSFINHILPFETFAKYYDEIAHYYSDRDDVDIAEYGFNDWSQTLKFIDTLIKDNVVPKEKWTLYQSNDTPVPKKPISPKRAEVPIVVPIPKRPEVPKKPVSTLVKAVNVIETPSGGCVIGKIGLRSSMEDEHVVVTYGDNVNFYGVFDGHGGDYVAKFLVKTLPNELFKALQKIDITDEKALKSAIADTYLHVDEMIFAEKKKHRAGSTATAILQVDNTLYFINLGDSRSILVENGALVLETKDHKPSDATERSRYEAVGFEYMPASYYSVARVIDPSGYGGIAVSRAFGDEDFKIVNNVYLGSDAPLSPIPDILKYTMSPNKKYVALLACDGLWDVASSERMAQKLNQDLQKGSLQQVCGTYVDMAIGDGSRDNVSVMIVPLKTTQQIGGNTLLDLKQQKAKLQAELDTNLAELDVIKSRLSTVVSDADIKKIRDQLDFVNKNKRFFKSFETTFNEHYGAHAYTQFVNFFHKRLSDVLKNYDVLKDINFKNGSVQDGFSQAYRKLFGDDGWRLHAEVSKLIPSYSNLSDLFTQLKKTYIKLYNVNSEIDKN